MRLTFLAHSGFLVELKDCCLLFDYWKGSLPPLPQKPLVVFASHRHPDHFNPEIFALADGRDGVTFVLSNDIRLGPKKQEKYGLSAEAMDHVILMGAGEQCSLPGGGPTVETLPSTDEGVAFIVSCGGKVFYHAGDLNWWAWDGESEDYNRSMEADFKRYLEPLSGRTVDVAFAPLDPRLGSHSGQGLAWLLNTAAVGRAFPMHLWGDFELIGRFKGAHPDLAPAVADIAGDGESWDLTD